MRRMVRTSLAHLPLALTLALPLPLTLTIGLHLPPISAISGSISGDAISAETFFAEELGTLGLQASPSALTLSPNPQP